MPLVRCSILALLCGPILSVGLADDLPPRMARAGTKVTEENGSYFYRGMTVNIASLVDTDDPEPTLAAVRSQIDMVVSAKVKPEVARFFRRVPVVLGNVPGGGPGVSHHGPIVLLKSEPIPSTWRVLIHELLHTDHFTRMTPDQRRRVSEFYKAADGAYEWDETEYFWSNEAEFFAVTASIYLCGGIGRPPHERSVIQAAQLEYVKFLSDLFDPNPISPIQPTQPSKSASK